MNSRNIQIPTTFLFLIISLLSGGFTQVSSDNILSVQNNNEYQSVGYSDIWGWVAPDGHEYAIINPRTGTSIIDLEQNPPEELGFIPGSQSIWHDTKTYKNYAYTVADEGNQGIQIIDLSALPHSVVLTKTWFGDGNTLLFQRILLLK